MTWNTAEIISKLGSSMLPTTFSPPSGLPDTEKAAGVSGLAPTLEAKYLDPEI
jgi:hypothetical protein